MGHGLAGALMFIPMATAPQKILGVKRSAVNNLQAHTVGKTTFLVSS